MWLVITSDVYSKQHHIDTLLPFFLQQFKDSASAERSVQNLNDFVILDRKIKVTLITENTLGGGGAMELLDGDEFQGGVGLTLQSRASLMAKLAETHNVGEWMELWLATSRSNYK